jgi:hypothetical protein
VPVLALLRHGRSHGTQRGGALLVVLPDGGLHRRALVCERDAQRRVPRHRARARLQPTDDVADVQPDALVQPYELPELYADANCDAQRDAVCDREPDAFGEPHTDAVADLHSQPDAYSQHDRVRDAISGDVPFAHAVAYRHRHRHAVLHGNYKWHVFCLSDCQCLGDSHSDPFKHRDAKSLAQLFGHGDNHANCQSVADIERHAEAFELANSNSIAGCYSFSDGYAFSDAKPLSHAEYNDFSAADALTDRFYGADSHTHAICFSEPDALSRRFIQSESISITDCHAIDFAGRHAISDSQCFSVSDALAHSQQLANSDVVGAYHPIFDFDFLASAEPEHHA